MLDIFDTESISEQGAWLHLRNPMTGDLAYLDDDEDKPVRIKTRGPDSPIWVEYIRNARRTQDKMDESEIAREDAKALAKMTLEWENLRDDSGEYVEFSEKKAREIYTKFKSMRDQLTVHVVRRDAFFASALVS